MKIPIKYRVLSLILEKDNISDEEILTILRTEYPFDKQVNEKELELCLMSLTGSKMIEIIHATLRENGKIEQIFKITNYGHHRLKDLFSTR